uniref:Coiled-coil domain-containing protein 112 n=1 Tax=Clastoptera arizonana TaxID=38151 RepID=A0A1B6EAR7_9HEMI
MMKKKLYTDSDGSLARLKRHQNLLEREYEKKLSKLKTSYSSNSRDFLELCSKLNNARNKDMINKNEDISRIESNVTDLSNILKNNENLKISDEKHLCNKVVSLSRDIFKMKDSLHIESQQLLSEEEKISNDLNSKYKAIEEFVHQLGLKKRNVKLKYKNNEVSQSGVQARQFQEVKDFQKFLDETGGHYGGWREEDHLLFLKISSKNKPHKTAEIIHHQLPDKTLEDVIYHEEWYRKYTNLREAKKKAIRNWKENHQSSQHSDEKVKCDDHMNNIHLKRDPEEKIKIEQWKAEQQLKKDKEREEHKIRELEKQKKETERKKLMLQKREIVNNYRKDKLEIEMALSVAQKEQEAQEMRRKAAEAKIMLKQFRIEDRKFTDRLKARRTSLKSEEEVSIKSLVVAERDPERLLKPTKVWLERTKKDNTEGEPKEAPQSMFILRVPHLGKPTWRTGVTT